MSNFGEKQKETAGMPGAVQEAISTGGGIPAGVQQAADRSRDVALFHSPETGSTLGLPLQELTAEAVVLTSRNTTPPLG